ncbi:hypothetical protein Hdeb2414_s0013g00419991 [Helianthus debilis subsp. tardiflorus]
MDLRSAFRLQRNPGAPSTSLLLDFNRPTTQTPRYHSRSLLPRPAQTADHHLSGGGAQTTAATAAFLPHRRWWCTTVVKRRN